MQYIQKVLINKTTFNKNLISHCNFMDKYRIQSQLLDFDLEVIIRFIHLNSSHAYIHTYIHISILHSYCTCHPTLPNTTIRWY